MDISSAIQKIQDDAAALYAANERKTDVPSIILPKDYALHSLDVFNKNRTFFRGSFKTRKVADFVNYLEKQGTAVSIFVDKFTAGCIIDLGTIEEAGGCRHTANLTIDRTPEFNMFHGKLNSRLNQQEFSEFLEDCAEYISLSNSAGSLDMAKCISAVRSVTITTYNERTHMEGQLSKSRSNLDSIEAKSVGELQLPTALVFKCKIADGFNERDFKCRISAVTGRDEVEFILRPSDLEKQLEEAEKELGVQLSTVKDSTVLYGTLDVGLGK